MQPEPLILAFDTSAAHCAVALLLGDEVLAERFEEMQRGQAENLFPLLEETLAAAGKSFADLSAIGVGTGPGNFTGIRLSVAAARGLALSLEIPAIGVTRFEALAEGVERPVLACVDARRDEAYLGYLDDEGGVDYRIAPVGAIPAEFKARSLRVTGYGSQEIAESLGGEPVVSDYGLAAAIARIAARSYPDATLRPAPLYIRKADAAPAREVAPVIMP